MMDKHLHKAASR